MENIKQPQSGMERPHLLLIDGMALLFRAFYATAVHGRFMRTPDGVPTNAVQGFIGHALSAQSIFRPTHMAVCWDMGAYTFRNDLYEGYKANRPAPPEEMGPQFEMGRESAWLLGWKSFGMDGVEADDVIGSLVYRWRDEADITIVSGDKDLLQLLSPGVRIAFMKKGHTVYDLYTYDRFKEEYGFEPGQFVDLKAFTGDSSDGYPGVRGIGPKTASALILEHGTVDGVLAAIDRLKPSVRKKIDEELVMLKLSRELAEIDCHIPIPGELDDMAVPSYSQDTMQALEAEGYGTAARQLLNLFPVEEAAEEWPFG
ncbi:5'-3' exonuclease [Bhargavaea cecembensis]|uniref:5'-3' exonuclease n=1 Tax=Bhargavaea cecembensis TaxID=394098 RepID=UPI000B089C5D|nr:5'-3' exonuclease [Bhargavaea cecembensis]